MVFDPNVAPRKKAEFLTWYSEQVEWKEGHSYDDPAISAPPLRDWFMEMIRTFPAMNGPHASEDVDDPKMADYSVGTSVIYVGFGWPMADEAHTAMFETAKKHGLGFFNASGSDDEIYFPVNGELVPIKQLGEIGGASKSKWKFW